MSDPDYLWEKKGQPAPETQELEALLSQARFSGMTLPEARPRRGFRWAVAAGGIAAAAALLIFGVVQRGPFLEVRDAAGGVEKLYVNRWFETGEGEQARIRVADIGEVQLNPQSRLRLVRTDAQQHRLELTRGSLHAKVDAPPRLFIIDTPLATAVDLGCEYDLYVDPAGGTRLDVHTGWVELQGRGKQSTVPAGMGSVTRAETGPGLPIDEKAPAAFRDAAERFDKGDFATVNELLAASTVNDAVTLWHLLARAEPSQRGDVVARLKVLVPAEVDEMKAVALDKQTLDTWWEAIVAQREGHKVDSLK